MIDPNPLRCLARRLATTLIEWADELDVAETPEPRQPHVCTVAELLALDPGAIALVLACGAWDADLEDIAKAEASAVERAPRAEVLREVRARLAKYRPSACDWHWTTGAPSGCEDQQGCAAVRGCMHDCGVFDMDAAETPEPVPAKPTTDAPRWVRDKGALKLIVDCEVVAVIRHEQGVWFASGRGVWGSDATSLHSFDGHADALAVVRKWGKERDVIVPMVDHCDGDHPMPACGSAECWHGRGIATWESSGRLAVGGKIAATITKDGETHRVEGHGDWWGTQPSVVGTEAEAVAAIIEVGLIYGVEVPPFYEVAEGTEWSEALGRLLLCIDGEYIANACGDGASWRNRAGSGTPDLRVDAPNLHAAVGEIIRRAASQEIGVPWPDEWPEAAPVENPKPVAEWRRVEGVLRLEAGDQAAVIRASANGSTWCAIGFGHAQACDNEADGRGIVTEWAEEMGYEVPPYLDADALIDDLVAQRRAAPVAVPLPPIKPASGGREDIDAEPACDISGRCEPSGGHDCAHCGKELHEGAEAGCWFTWDWASHDSPRCQVHDSDACPLPVPEVAPGAVAVPAEPEPPAPKWEQRTTSEVWRLYIGEMPVARLWVTDGYPHTEGLNDWKRYEEASHVSEHVALGSVVAWGLEQTPPVEVPPLPCAECGGSEVVQLPMGDDPPAPYPCQACTPAPEATATDEGDPLAGWEQHGGAHFVRGDLIVHQTAHHGFLAGGAKPWAADTTKLHAGLPWYGLHATEDEAKRAAHGRVTEHDPHWTQRLGGGE